jgi:hypothetical protein
MIDNGEGNRPGHGRRSRLAELADMTVPTAAAPDTRDDSIRIRQEIRVRQEFAALLGEFRRTAVQLPLGEDACPLTAESKRSVTVKFGNT